MYEVTGGGVHKTINFFDSIYDFIDFEFSLCVVIIAIVFMRLDTLKSALLLIHLVTIFLLNGILFPATYFVDQHAYVVGAEHIRGSLDFSEAFTVGTKIGLASSIFALFPMPFIVSVKSGTEVRYDSLESICLRRLALTKCRLGLISCPTLRG